MSSEELENKLSRIKDKKLATEVRRFLLNLFLLFDGSPPPHIQAYIDEILELLEDKKYSVKLIPEKHSAPRFSFVKLSS